MIYKMCYGFIMTILIQMHFSNVNCQIIPSASTKSNDATSETTALPVELNNILDEMDEKMLAIDQIMTPSDICKEIVSKFASAISNFSLCSITNSRPIHLCEWCVGFYLRVVETHNDFLVTIDEKGNPCREYFTNLDRIEIVTDAYLYVQNLWKKGKCDYCFKRNETIGSIIPEITPDVSNFETDYQLTKSCFNVKRNDTCIQCKVYYEKMNSLYIEISDKYGDNICLDVVDTMNTTREIWSEIFRCNPERKVEFWLHVGMCIVAVIPFLFYFFAYVLSSKQETRVLQQRRWAEASGVTSYNSEGAERTGFVWSTMDRSSTSNTNTTQRSRSTKP